MIGITGASGQLGQLVLEELLQLNVSPKSIVAIARTPEKLTDFAEKGIDVRYGDYSKPDTLNKALEGLRKLLLISSSEVGQRTNQHQAVIAAAKRQSVPFIAYTSILRAPESPLLLAAEHQQTEDILQESGLDICILRNGWYSENYTMGIGNALNIGGVYGCAGDGKFSTAPRRDYALAAATVLSQDKHSNKIYELAGDEGFSLTDFANFISKDSGKNISYNNLEQDSFKNVLVEAGLPEGFAALLANSEAEAAHGWLFDDQHQLSQLIGRKTVPISTSVKEVIASQ